MTPDLLHPPTAPNTPARAIASVDAAWAQRVAHRLRGELGAVVESLPPAAQRATGLARALGLRVPLCHRVLAGVRAQGDAVAVLGAFPGVDGLRMFLDAVQKSRLVRGPRLAGASAAITQLHELILRGGGSQRRLLDALAGEQPAPSSPTRVGSGTSEDSRKRLYEAMAEQLGCYARAVVAVRIYTPAQQPTLRGDLDATGAIGRLGFVRTSASMPYTTSYRTTLAQPDEPQAFPFLMSDFCTRPLPNVVVQEIAPHRIGIVDAAFECADPIDVVAGPLTRRNVVVSEQGNLFLNGATLSASPSTTMLSDFYLPKDWSVGADCSAGVYREEALGAVVGDPAKRWFDRLPATVLPSLLGRGLAMAGAECHATHVQLTRRLFEHAGADPDQYVGYRLHVNYPLPYMHYVSFSRPTP
jgi:hypothetical protein